MDLPFADFLLTRYAYRAARRRPVSPLPVDLSAVRRVLLVLTTGIGDAVLSSAVFPSLRSALPNAEIRLFCRGAWCDLFSADSNLDGLIPYAGKFRRFWTTLKSLRAFAPDLALVLHGNDPDILPLCHLAGSRYIVRVPTAGTRFGMLLSNRARTEDAATLPGLHYIDNRLRILDSIGIPVVTRSPAIHLDTRLVEAVHTRLAGFLHGRPYWVLHAHAADKYKSMPPNLVAELVEQGLSRFPEFCLVLTGGPENRMELERIAADHGSVFVAAGRFSLAETGACIAGASALVGPDTGILHLAAALDRPTVGLYAPTRAALVGPRAPNAVPTVIEKAPTCDPCDQKRCPYRPVKCMQQFRADEILAAVADHLGA